MLKIELMPDLSEVIPYEQARIPLYIRTADLSIYPDMSAPCHWHEDLEWIHILEGTMCYDINGRRLVLEKQDSLMVNARQMHYGYSLHRQDCRFLCVLFHPSLFCSNQSLMQRYVEPMLKNCCLEYLHLPSGHVHGPETADFLLRIADLKESAEEGYELEAISLMQILWSRLWKYRELGPGPDGREMDENLKIQKDMVSFLYQHYGEKITLDEIAASGHVSRSKCCRLFKHYLQQSPVDFLNAYRLRVSLHLLDTTDQSVTDIALACGFRHLSYFSRYFYNHYGCTPREYRRRKCLEAANAYPFPSSASPPEAITL